MRPKRTIETQDSDEEVSDDDSDDKVQFACYQCEATFANSDASIRHQQDTHKSGPIFLLPLSVVRELGTRDARRIVAVYSDKLTLLENLEGRALLTIDGVNTSKSANESAKKSETKRGKTKNCVRRVAATRPSKLKVKMGAFFKPGCVSPIKSKVQTSSNPSTSTLSLSPLEQNQAMIPDESTVVKAEPADPPTFTIPTGFFCYDCDKHIKIDDYSAHERVCVPKLHLFKCYECGRRCRTLRELNYHKKCEHRKEINTWFCDRCSGRFSTATIFASHRKTCAPPTLGMIISLAELNTSDTSRYSDCDPETTADVKSEPDTESVTSQTENAVDDLTPASDHVSPQSTEHRGELENANAEEAAQPANDATMSNVDRASLETPTGQTKSEKDIDSTTTTTTTALEINPIISGGNEASAALAALSSRVLAGDTAPMTMRIPTASLQNMRQIKLPGNRIGYLMPVKKAKPSPTDAGSANDKVVFTVRNLTDQPIEKASTKNDTATGSTSPSAIFTTKMDDASALPQHLQTDLSKTNTPNRRASTKCHSVTRQKSSPENFTTKINDESAMSQLRKTASSKTSAPIEKAFTKNDPVTRQKSSPEIVTTKIDDASALPQLRKTDSSETNTPIEKTSSTSDSVTSHKSPSEIVTTNINDATTMPKLRKTDSSKRNTHIEKAATKSDSVIRYKSAPEIVTTEIHGASVLPQRRKTDSSKTNKVATTSGESTASLAQIKTRNMSTMDPQKPPLRTVAAPARGSRSETQGPITDTSMSTKQPVVDNCTSSFTENKQVVTPKKVMESPRKQHNPHNEKYDRREMVITVTNCPNTSEEKSPKKKQNSPKTSPMKRVAKDGNDTAIVTSPKRNKRKSECLDNVVRKLRTDIENGNFEHTDVTAKSRRISERRKIESVVVTMSPQKLPDKRKSVENMRVEKSLQCRYTENGTQEGRGAITDSTALTRNIEPACVVSNTRPVTNTKPAKSTFSTKRPLRQEKKSKCPAVVAKSDEQTFGGKTVVNTASSGRNPPRPPPAAAANRARSSSLSTCMTVKALRSRKCRSSIVKWNLPQKGLMSRPTRRLRRRLCNALPRRSRRDHCRSETPKRVSPCETLQNVSPESTASADEATMAPPSAKLVIPIDDGTVSCANCGHLLHSISDIVRHECACMDMTI